MIKKTIRLHHYLYAPLKQEADEEFRSVSEMIRYILQSEPSWNDGILQKGEKQETVSIFIDAGSVEKLKQEAANHKVSFNKLVQLILAKRYKEDAKKDN